MERRHDCRVGAAATAAITRAADAADITGVAGEFLGFVARRLVAAAILVLLVSSAAMVLARLAPGSHISIIETDPVVAKAECARIGCEEPIINQYAIWLGRALRFDFGQSLKYHRPVSALVSERAGNSVVLGLWALLVATALGIPAGVFTGSRRGGALVRATRGGSILLLSLPPLITALTLLVIASRTGWFPVAGSAPADATVAERARFLVLPVVALALPMAATLERLQSRAIADVLAEPCMLAASARGIPATRLIWRHAWKLSLKPVLAIYGIVIGALISGSFAVEYIMAWPGLGSLMYEALVARDAYLVAGCAAAGSVALAFGILIADIALAAIDPRFARTT
jgi:peptide/nickel transport system permease protein